MIDADLAALYGVPTKRLNEQVKRNAGRFPVDLAFQLSCAERDEVVANCDHLRRIKFSPTMPFAFTEHGALMAASVLNTPRAVEVRLYVVRAFAEMSNYTSNPAPLIRSHSFRSRYVDMTLSSMRSSGRWAGARTMTRPSRSTTMSAVERGLRTIA